MGLSRSRAARLLALGTAATTVAALLALVPSAAQADTRPASASTPTTASTDSLPTAQLALSMPRGGGAMSGTLNMAPYSAGDARLALAPVRFAALGNGATRIDTVALLDGPLSGGAITGLRVPVNGTLGPGSAIAFGRGCVPVSFATLRLGGLKLGRTSLPVCAIGSSGVRQLLRTRRKFASGS